MSIRKSLDVSRLANAVARPGIDPRVWITQATIKEIGFDPNEGLFADVVFIPEGIEETCMIGTPYAADEAGLYCPHEPGDVVLVAVPHGDTGYGPVIFAKLWSKASRPASEMRGATADDATGDVVLRVKQGRSLRIASKDGEVHITGEGSGKITIETTGSQSVTVKSATSVEVNAPSVLLGDSPGSPIARVGDIVSVTIPPLVIGAPKAPGPASAGDPVGTPTQPTSILAPGIPIIATGKIVSGKQGVKA